MNKQSVALALKGYSRRELPGWGWVLRRAGVFDDSVWREAPTAVAEGKLHGFRMELDLRNWSERQTYFLGRFYDLPTQLLVMRLLRRGDLFVDVGANIGMISALAARCVGPEGRVLAFEPNPDAMRRLRRLIETNDLAERIEALSSALSDAEGTMTLSVITEHTGMGTLSEVPPEQRGLVSGTHEVPVEIGDLVLAGRGPVAGMKIDVEGFESHVIGGLLETLRRDRPWIVAEVIEEHLRRAGTSSAALLAKLAGLGYEAHAISLRRTGLRHGLQLARLGARDLPVRSDVLFLPEDSPLRAAVLAAEH